MAGTEASVSALDRGFTVGDGVFETIRVIDGNPFAMDRHLARLHSSANRMGFPDPDDDYVRAACKELLDAWVGEVGGDARLRITLTSGIGPPGSGRATPNPTMVVMVTPLGSTDPTTAVVTVNWRRNAFAATAGIKTTSYADCLVALAEAHSRGATEALMANTAGELCEGTGSNVFVAIDDRLLTPPLSSGCLAGVTRALVLEAGCGAIEHVIPFDSLSDATEIFLTSTTRKVQAVAVIDGRPIGKAPGPHTRRAVEAFEAMVRRTRRKP
jgi:branched-chain amino acid aminotransferase